MRPALLGWRVGGRHATTDPPSAWPRPSRAAVHCGMNWNPAERTRLSRLDPPPSPLTRATNRIGVGSDKDLKKWVGSPQKARPGTKGGPCGKLRGAARRVSHDPHKRRRSCFHRIGFIRHDSRRGMWHNAALALAHTFRHAVVRMRGRT